MLVQRAWKRAGLQPHRLERYMASNDPDFEVKAGDVIGLYLKPPQHAAVFCFEYRHCGTLSLFAALDTKTGRVVGKTVSRHTSAEFVAFLGWIVAHEPAGREIHAIADNLSTHKTKAVREFLEPHPNVRLHHTPTYPSWLNQIELWFSKLKRDLLARGVFTPVKDLDPKS